MISLQEFLSLKFLNSQSTQSLELHILDRMKKGTVEGIDWGYCLTQYDQHYINPYFLPFGLYNHIGIWAT